eukprot:5414920-Prorocentrum_lima.AAC.1
MVPEHLVEELAATDKFALKILLHLVAVGKHVVSQHKQLYGPAAHVALRPPPGCLLYTSPSPRDSTSS